MRNKTIFRVAVCIIILSTFILPVSAQQPDKTNEYEVSLKKLMEVTGASASIDEVLSYTLSVANGKVYAVRLVQNYRLQQFAGRDEILYWYGGAGHKYRHIFLTFF